MAFTEPSRLYTNSAIDKELKQILGKKLISCRAIFAVFGFEAGLNNALFQEAFMHDAANPSRAQMLRIAILAVTTKAIPGHTFTNAEITELSTAYQTFLS